jgi:hypothetical protein
MDLICLGCTGTVPVLWLSRSPAWCPTDFRSEAKCPGCFHVVTIIKFRHCLLIVVCFLLGNSPASEFYMSTFQNTSIFIGG